MSWKIKLLQSKLEHWIMVHLCPGEYDHMRHLISDVISLEQEIKRLCQEQGELKKQ